MKMVNCAIHECSLSGSLTMTSTHIIINVVATNSSQVSDRRSYLLGAPEQDQNLIYEMCAQIVNESVRRKWIILPGALQSSSIAIIADQIRLKMIRLR